MIKVAKAMRTITTAGWKKSENNLYEFVGRSDGNRSAANWEQCALHWIQIDYYFYCIIFGSLT